VPAGAAAAATVGSSVAGGILGSGAAAANSKLAQQTAAENNQVATGVYQTNTANEQPFVNTGQSANSGLANLLGLNGASGTAAQTGAFDNYLNSTNYQFQLGQGENAVKTANAPDFNSGATAKALNNYAQGQAGSALGGYESELGGLSTTGANSAGTLGQLGVDEAAQVASNNNAALGVETSANVFGANAATQAAGGVASSLNNPFVQNAFSGIGNSSFGGGTEAFGSSPGSTPLINTTNSAFENAGPLPATLPDI
jgi:hypothetical protein